MAMYYFEQCVKQRVLIVGMLPPPLGGIGVHIKRKCAFLRAHGAQVYVIDVCKESAVRSKIGYAWSLMRRVLSFQPHVVYYHTLSLRSNFVELILLIMLKWCRGSKLVIVEHSGRFLYARSWLYKKILNMCICGGVDEQILMGQPMVQAYRDNDMVLLPSMCMAQAFIEPDSSEEFTHIQQYPDVLWQFMRTKNMLFILNASSISLWQNQDLYGFDLAITLLADLPEDCGLICVVGAINNQRYHDSVMSALDRWSEKVYVMTGCHAELWPLIKRADCLLRPTRWDTASVSIQEALFLGKPVIASNACVRPEPCVLFESGNYEDFLAKVKTVYDQYTRQCDSADAQSCARCGDHDEQSVHAN